MRRRAIRKPLIAFLPKNRKTVIGICNAKMMTDVMKNGQDPFTAIKEEERQTMMISAVKMSGQMPVPENEKGISDYVKHSKMKTPDDAFRFGEYLSSPEFRKDFRVGANGKIDYVYQRPEPVPNGPAAGVKAAEQDVRAVGDR